MSTKLIEPETHLRLRFNTGGQRMFKFRVEADHPVDTYLVDEEGYEEFLEGQEIPSEGGFTRRQRHEQTLRLPHRGPWFLLVVNRRKNPVAVHYETYY